MPSKNSSPIPKEILIELEENPSKFFRHHTPNDNSRLEWSPHYGDILAPYDYPQTHGQAIMPNIECVYTDNGQTVVIGWIQIISMYGGGYARIGHFALAEELSNFGIGASFLAAIIQFFKDNNALYIDFAENRGDKMEHYRHFFAKYGIPEREEEEDVWRVDLYQGKQPPQSVIDYQEMLHSVRGKERREQERKKKELAELEARPWMFNKISNFFSRLFGK